MTPLEVSEHRRRLHSLVEKYTRSFPEFRPASVYGADRDPTTTAVVMLSGSTGAFGTNILAELVAKPEVRRVYAVSRPGKDDVRERHASALRREGYDPETILSSPKVRLVEADLSIVGFGVAKDTLEELETSVTHIIHNGWKVNFNAPVSEFEPNIRSVRNLVDFSLQTRARADQPARLIFISSIGMFQSEDSSLWKSSANNGSILPDADPSSSDNALEEKRIDEPDCSFGLGYAEAKWVSEHILDHAARRTPLKPTIVRLGQIVGGPGGYWNEKDWFPILIKSSVYLRLLPAVPGVFSWNRTHIKARALLDMLETKERYVHLVNPKPIPETVLITIFARKLCLPVVHINDWVSALQRSYNAIIVAAAKLEGEHSRTFRRKAFHQNPAARMLDFFKKVQESCQDKPLSPDQTTACTPLVRCEKAVKASRTLRDPSLPEIGEEDVNRWLDSWRAVGFLDNQTIEGVGIRYDM